MRWLALIIVLAIIGLMDAWIMRRHSDAAHPAPPVAARDLAANHRLQASDVDLPWPGPRYLTHAVKKGEPIQDVSEQPTLTAATAGAVLSVVSVDRALVSSGALDAGVDGIVCLGPQTLTPKPAPVRAVLCSSADACVAVMELPAAEAAGLGAPAAPAVLSARPAASQCR